LKRKEAASILVDHGGLVLNDTASSMTRFRVDVRRGSKAAAAIVEEMPTGGDGAFQRGIGRHRHEHGSMARSGVECCIPWII
jgi:hypothetical protein